MIFIILWAGSGLVGLAVMLWLTRYEDTTVADLVGGLVVLLLGPLALLTAFKAWYDTYKYAVVWRAKR